MADTEFLGGTKEADVERSTEELRQDIAKEKDSISQTVEEIGERLKEKLDWREHVKESPYLALAAAAGLGYLASGIFKTRTTPLEQIMDSMAEKASDTVGDIFNRPARPNLIKVTLLCLATKAASNWIKKTAVTSVANGGDRLRPQTGDSSTINTKVSA